MRARWKDEDGAIYEWDYAHGTVERYDSRGVITKANLPPIVVSS
jgi:hypothetical protein